MRAGAGEDSTVNRPTRGNSARLRLYGVGMAVRDLTGEHTQAAALLFEGRIPAPNTATLTFTDGLTLPLG